MDIGLESFLVALLFVLPGFLTSRLIDARTPAASSQPSAFHETADSLLRSAIVHILIVLVIFPVLYAALVSFSPSTIPAMRSEGVPRFFASRPDLIPIVAALWSLVAFSIAGFFGFKWDPLQVLLSRLNKGQGTITDDLMSLLVSALHRARNRDPRSQLWVQVRTATGHTYQGEFVFGSYRVKDLNRELLLAAVTHFSPPADKTSPAPQEAIDYALLDLSKCDPVEARIIPSSASSASA